MEYSNFLDKITLYLDGEMNSVDKANFEKALSENYEWNQIFEDIKRNDKLIKNLPKIRTNQNFIVQLNQRIDNYEISFLSRMKNYIYNLKPTSALGMASLAIVLIFSVYKVSNLTYKNNLASSQD